MPAVPVPLGRGDRLPLIAAALLLSALLLSPGLNQRGYGTEQAGAPAALQALANLPLDFIRNEGQWQESTSFVAAKGEVTAAFGPDSIALRLGAQTAPVNLRFEGAAKSATIVGERERSTRYNFYFGSDPAKWYSEVAAYGSILYRGLYQGVDARVREAGSRLEYDLLLEPGADLDRVVIRAAGASKLRIADDDALLMTAGRSSLRQPAPIAWQTLPDGSRRHVESRFRLIDRARYGFEVSGRDATLPLVIDPGLEWATYLGGEGNDEVTGIALAQDGSGDVIVSGSTRSPDFPHTRGNHAPTGVTPYVARLNSTGSALVYSTFFGGSLPHAVLDLAVDAQSRPVIVGETMSVDFPVTQGAYDTSPPFGNNGDYDGFVVKFDASGSSVVFGTYLGGANNTGTDIVREAVVEPSGNVVVAGTTQSASFPTTPGAFDRTSSGGNGFVSRLSADGSQLLYSTFLSGDGGTDIFGLAVDPLGFATVTGRVWTTGTGFPITSGAYDSTFGGPGSSGTDAFLVRLKLDGAGTADLRYGTFLGGAQNLDNGTDVAVDPNDSTLVTVGGWTRSGDFPTTPGAFLRTHFGPNDMAMPWIGRFSFPAGGGGTLRWLTYLGQAGSAQTIDDLLVDSTGAAITVGGSGDGNPPTTERAYDRTPLGEDAYAARISGDGSQLLYFTLFGGSDQDWIARAAYAGGTTLVVAGQTQSRDFPVTSGANDRLYAADGRLGDINVYDSFVARIDLQGAAGGDVTPPAAPSVVAPTEGARFTATVTVTVDWTDVSDPSGIEAYQFQVSPTADFVPNAGSIAGTFRQAWLPTSVYPLARSVSNTGTMYLRVRALDRAHNLGPWSPVRTFFVDSPTPPPAPVLQSPPNNSVFAPGSVTFAWNAAPRANFYTIQVDTNSSFSNPDRIWIRAIAATRHTLTFPDARVRWWRVLAENDSFINSPWSTVWRFETRAGAPPAPAPPPLPPGEPGSTEPATALASIGSDLSVNSGGTGQVTVTLNGVAPAGGAVVPIAVSLSDVLSAPASVTVPAGSGSASFTVTAQPGVPRTQTAILSAEWGGVTRAKWVYIFGSNPLLYSFTATPTPLLGGATAQGTVSLIPGWTAPPGGLLVPLASSNPARASVPASVRIPEGSSSTTFTITTSGVSTRTPVTIFAARGTTLEARLEVMPPGALQSLTLNPTTVVGGNPSQGTVTLAGAAPAAGVVVALSVINPQWAQVPPSVTVPAGASSATFTVTTSNTTGEGQFSIITASAAGIERSQSITVTPGPPGGDTGLRSPTANAATSGGDSNGYQTNPGNAHTNDGLFAVDTDSGSGTSTSCTSSSKDKHLFRDYGFSIPSGSTIRGIEVRLDAKADSTSSSPKLCAQLSWDGGSSWTSAKSTPTLTTAEASYTLGSATDTWGRTWSLSSFSNTSFRVRVIDVASSTSRDFSLDWVAVRVSH